MKKFDLKESNFSSYSNKTKVVSNKKISNDASFNLYIIAKAYDEVRTRKEYWWGEYYYSTDYKFNKNNSIIGFEYEIILSDKGYGKAKSVSQALQNTLNGYTRTESNESEHEGEFYYTNNQQSITFHYSYALLDIELMNLVEKISKHEEYIGKYSDYYDDYDYYADYEPIYYAKAIEQRVYFYNNPNYYSETSSYYVKGQEAEVIDFGANSDFYYVSFEYKGRITTGYILKSDVIIREG